MKTKEKVEAPDNGIEEVVCKAFDACTKQPLSKDQMSLMISFIMANMDPNPESKAAIDELFEKVWIAQAAVKRMEAQFGRKLNKECAIMLAEHCETIGAAVLNTYYIQYKAKQLDHKGDIDMDFFCERVYPLGYIPEKVMHEVWDAQKMPDGSNMVDHGKAATTLMDE